MVMSAVSSVRTPGVLVTVMPRPVAAVTSMLSTPLPKLAISFSRSPALARTAASTRSVTVGTSTSAIFAASASSAWLKGRSSRLSRVSNNSRMRVSTLSGSFRVTTTSGFFRIAMAPTFGLATRGIMACGRSGLLNRGGRNWQRRRGMGSRRLFLSIRWAGQDNTAAVLAGPFTLQASITSPVFVLGRR
jgi:hypothetical protein